MKLSRHTLVSGCLGGIVGVVATIVYLGFVYSLPSQGVPSSTSGIELIFVPIVGVIWAAGSLLMAIVVSLALSKLSDAKQMIVTMLLILTITTGLFGRLWVVTLEERKARQQSNETLS